MTCGGCENAVKRTLRLITGVEDVTASHTAHEVVVSFDASRVNAQMIRERIEGLGYRVES